MAGSDPDLVHRLHEIANKFTSQSALARESGIKRSTLGDYLVGNTKPGVDELVALARAAGVSFEWLATGEGQRPASPGEEYILWDPQELRELILLVDEICDTWLHDDEELTPDRRAWIIAEAYAREMRYREAEGRDMPLNAVGRLVLELTREKHEAAETGERR